MTTAANKGKKFPPESLKASEARALIYALSDSPIGLRNRALIAAMYGGGLRASEALALRPSDIDVDRHSIFVRCGKGSKSRTVGIDAGALLHVTRWMDRRRALKIPGTVLMCTFRGKKGTPLNDRYLRRMIEETAVKAGLERRAHPHGLRHTHAAELEASGIVVTMIQKQLGHKSLGTTQAYLDHISPTARLEQIAHRREIL